MLSFLNADESAELAQNPHGLATTELQSVGQIYIYICLTDQRVDNLFKLILPKSPVVSKVSMLNSRALSVTTLGLYRQLDKTLDLLLLTIKG